MCQLPISASSTGVAQASLRAPIRVVTHHETHRSAQLIHLASGDYAPAPRGTAGRRLNWGRGPQAGRGTSGRRL
jgi:hypothetical protein